MNISHFPKYIFWEYSDFIDLPEEIIINKVFIYGDLDDMMNLPKYVSKEKMIEVFNKIKNSGKLRKRINFIEKVILEK